MPLDIRASSARVEPTSHRLGARADHRRAHRRHVQRGRRRGQKGQELFRLDRRPLEGALQQAPGQHWKRDMAQAANAEGAGSSAIWTSPPGRIATKEQVDTTRARPRSRSTPPLEADKAAVENAKVQLRSATIKAPISGRTVALMVHEGNLVRANDTQPLVVINQITPIQASASTIGSAACRSCKRYMAQGAVTRRGRARPTTTAAVERPHHVRRQRRRPDDRHHQGQGHVPERRSAAVARTVRQRRR